MVRRNLKSDFVGGAFVFPGGAVDPLDGGAEAEAACAGRSDAEASILLGVDSGGLAYWVAALRETFEEAGLLLAERPGGPAAPGRRARGRGPLRGRAGRGERGHPPLPRPLPRRGAAPAGRRGALLRPLDRARGGPRAVSTPGSSWRRPRPGSRRRTMRARPSPTTWISPRRALEGHRNGRLRAHLPDHPQPAGHRPFRHRRRALGGGRERLALGADHRAAGGGRRERGADPAPGRRGLRRRARAPAPPDGGGRVQRRHPGISMAANQEGGPTDGGVSVPTRGRAGVTVR